MTSPSAGTRRAADIPEVARRHGRDRHSSILTITLMTFQEAHRRWVLWAVALMGVAFVALFALGFWLVHREVSQHSRVGDMFEASDFFLLSGLYAVYFLVIILAILTSVDTISGEIASGTIHTVVTKPLRRWEIIVGKWLGFAAMLILFTVALSGAVIIVVWLIADYVPHNPGQGILLIVLAGLSVLALSILGGTRLSTLTNGVVVFMLYGLAFIAGWIEQFGAFLENETAVNVGIVVSLVMPAEAMWKRAAYLMEPPILRDLGIHPMAAVSSPSSAMVFYTLVFIAVCLAAAVVLFQSRDL